MSPKCIALFSGGLDSTLALAVIARQDVEVIAFHATHVFNPRTDQDEGRQMLAARAMSLGAREIIFREASSGMINLTKAPAHGYGKNLNACLDCRMLTIGMGGKVMDETGADFIISGEVVGQRPMSQRRDAMSILDRHLENTGLAGKLLRPLCARQLEPTIPETSGMVDREKLYGFSGRSRKPQMALAAELGISDYPTPAGGCLLTDAGFCMRLKDLMDNQPGWNEQDARLLRVGRHFRLTLRTKIIASRRDVENDALEKLAASTDTLFITRDRPGAIVMIRGEAGDEARRIAAGLAVYYSKFRNAGKAGVSCWQPGSGYDERRNLGVQPVIDPADLGEMYIGHH